ncbi:unnamed protein product, partial [Amoebophrya sp. A25]
QEQQEELPPNTTTTAPAYLEDLKMFETFVVDDEISTLPEEDVPDFLTQIGGRIVDTFGNDHWLFAWVHYQNFEALEKVYTGDNSETAKDMAFSAAIFLDYWGKWFQREFLPALGIRNCGSRYSNHYLWQTSVLNRLSFLDQFVMMNIPLTEK